MLDDTVHRRTGLDHDHDPPWSLQAADELFERVIAHDPVGRPRVNLVYRFVLQLTNEFVGGGRRPIVDCDREAIVGHVQNQILAHHGQTNQTNIVL